MVDDYDLILMGDFLGVGLLILKDLFKEEGYFVGMKYDDCGFFIYMLD